MTGTGDATSIGLEQTRRRIIHALAGNANASGGADAGDALGGRDRVGAAAAESILLLVSATRGSVAQRVPVPRGRVGTRNGACDDPALATDPAQDAFVGQPMQEGEEGLLADAERRAEDVARHGRGGAPHEGEGARAEGIGRDGVIAHEARLRQDVRVVGAELRPRGRGELPQRHGGRRLRSGPHRSRGDRGGRELEDALSRPSRRGGRAVGAAGDGSGGGERRVAALGGRGAPRRARRSGPRRLAPASGAVPVTAAQEIAGRSAPSRRRPDRPRLVRRILPKRTTVGLSSPGRGHLREPGGDEAPSRGGRAAGRSGARPGGWHRPSLDAPRVYGLIHLSAVRARAIVRTGDG
jgi:hypothetical protein